MLLNIICTSVLLCLQLNLLTVTGKTFPTDIFQNNSVLAKLVCFDRELIIAIQRDQIEKARDNIFRYYVKSNLNISTGDDLSLYFHHFETLEVSVRSSETKRYNLIAYYRIYKNANDNIRTLLYNFEVAKRNKFKNPRFHSCIADDCHHPKITKVQKPKLKYLAYFSHERKRFPFVFVRDPLQRLISAITEVRRFETTVICYFMIHIGTR